MSSIAKRIAALFRIKANKALDKAEDPREVLDYSYEQQLQMLQKVRRGVADVATSRKRVELQVNQLEQQSAKLQGQAEKAISVGREDLAREALTRKSQVFRDRLLGFRLNEDRRDLRVGVGHLTAGAVEFFLLAFLVAKTAPGLSLLIYAGLPVLYFLSITVLRWGRKGNQEYADFT